MGNQLSYIIDKSEWPAGPWKDEPDREFWIDEETGYPCLIRRQNILGFWCGYIGISKENPLFEKKYEEESYDEIEVHGGITYSKHCDGNQNLGICHPSEDGDHVWWIGFDCAHAYDLLPSTDIYSLNVVYRDINYVKNEVKNLARQLRNMEELSIIAY